MHDIAHKSRGKWTKWSTDTDRKGKQITVSTSPGKSVTQGKKLNTLNIVVHVKHNTFKGGKRKKTTLAICPSNSSEQL